MSILMQYTLKYLLLNKKRTTVTILGVTLSCAMICGVFLLSASFQKIMIEREIAYTGNYHAMIIGVPFDKAKYILQNSAVASASLSTERVTATFGSRNKDKPYIFISAYDTSIIKTQPFKLVTGRLPHQDGELLVTPGLLASSGTGLQIGSPLKATLGMRTNSAGEVIDPYTYLDKGEIFIPSQTRTYTIVGVIQPAYTDSDTGSGYGAVAFLDPATLALDSPVNVSVVVKNPRRIYTTAPSLAEAAGLSMAPNDGGDATPLRIRYNDGVLTWMGIKPNAGFVRFFLVIIAIIIVLITVGSALVIYNAFSISVGERKKQFGMFASVGATARQIHRSVLFEALIIGLTGIPLGILSGIAGVGITLVAARNIITQVMGTQQGMQLVVSPIVIGLTILFSGSIILVSAWSPAHRASQVSPIQAIRLNEDARQKRPLDIKTSPLLRKVFGFEGELAMKSLKRDGKRYQTTVLSLMISIILFVAFNSLMLYTKTSAHLNNEATNYDVQVYLGSPSPDQATYIEQATRLPGIQSFSLLRCLAGQFQATRQQITGQAYQALNEFSPLSFADGEHTAIHTRVCSVGQAEFERYLGGLKLDLQSYISTVTNRAILVNENVIRFHKLYDFNYLNLKPDDKITITGYPQSESDQPGSTIFTLGAITGELPMGGSRPSQDTLLIVSDPVFDQAVLGLHNVDPYYSFLYFKTDHWDTLTADLSKLHQAILGSDFSYYSPAEANQRNNMTELMINIFFYGFLALITLVGVTNIVNTMNTNIQLRRREFAMLKSVGLTPKSFLNILCYESLFYGLQSLLLGLPIGIALSVLIYTRFGDVSQFGFSLPWAAILACTVGVLLIVFLTMMGSGAAIRNDNIVDTIKMENL